MKECSAPQPLTKPKMVGPFGAYDANVWQGPRRLLYLELGVLPPGIGKGNGGDVVAGTARAHRPHRAVSLWHSLGSAGKVKGRVWARCDPLEWLGGESRSVWPGPSRAARLIRDTGFSEATAGARADNLASLEVNKITFKKEIHLSCEGKFSKECPT